MMTVLTSIILAASLYLSASLLCAIISGVVAMVKKDKTPHNLILHILSILTGIGWGLFYYLN